MWVITIILWMIIIIPSSSPRTTVDHDGEWWSIIIYCSWCALGRCCETVVGGRANNKSHSAYVIYRWHIYHVGVNWNYSAVILSDKFSVGFHCQNIVRFGDGLGSSLYKVPWHINHDFLWYVFTSINYT